MSPETSIFDTDDGQLRSIATPYKVNHCWRWCLSVRIKRICASFVDVAAGCSVKVELETGTILNVPVSFEVEPWLHL
ncbi:MAG: hypothetical protein WAU25_13955 [Nitrososphaeraceae archaeon]